MSEFRIAALYHFFSFADCARHREALADLLAEHGVRGTLLLAPEGINGTIAGSPDGVAVTISVLRSIAGTDALEVKYSTAETQPFLRTKVRVKNEIVTMGKPDIDPGLRVGRYVDPLNWNDVLSDPNTVVIDTRNAYEVEIGTFDGAINPKIDSFREFPAWLDTFRADNPGKRIAMFCTGGIRCEKATSYALAQGADDVLHLKGGILKYLENVDEEASRWSGECFVFDGRVSVQHGLKRGTYDLCYACGMPIDDAMKEDAAYVQGVSCPQCVDTYTDERKEGFRERERQIALAHARGEQHFGR
ncbi:MAG: rhodanese-related sulfurtransferase [Pseudomonadota bacterium]